jgi:hypothetical protein
VFGGETWLNLSVANRAMSEWSDKDEAASAYDRAFAHVSTHFLPFLLRAGRLEKATRTRVVTRWLRLASR